MKYFFRGEILISIFRNRDFVQKSRFFAVLQWEPLIKSILCMGQSTRQLQTALSRQLQYAREQGFSTTNSLLFFREQMGFRTNELSCENGKTLAKTLSNDTVFRIKQNNFLKMEIGKILQLFREQMGCRINLILG